MEAELVEHIRIAPARQQLRLPRRQAGGVALCQLGRFRRRAESDRIRSRRHPPGRRVPATARAGTKARKSPIARRCSCRCRKRPGAPQIRPGRDAGRPHRSRGPDGMAASACRESHNGAAHRSASASGRIEAVRTGCGSDLAGLDVAAQPAIAEQRPDALPASGAK